VIGFAGIIILAGLLLHIPAVQRSIIHRVLSSVTEKTNTRIDVGYVSIAFTHSIVLNDIFIENSERDTLLSIGSVKVDINLLGLLTRTINVTNIRLDSVTAYISRASPDSSYNFDFILNAISSEPSAPSAQLDLDTSSQFLQSLWKFRLGGIQLHGVHGSFVDAVNRIDISFHIGAFEASVDNFDLEKGHYAVGNMMLSNSSLRVVSSSASPSDTVSPILPDISFASISLNNLHVSYSDSLSHDRFSVDCGSLLVAMDRIDLPLRTVAIKSIALDNSQISIQQGTSTPTKDSTGNDDPVAQSWTLSLGTADVRNNSLRVYTYGTAATTGLDSRHLQFEEITLQAKNMLYGREKISAEIIAASCREQSGLVLSRCSGMVEIDSTQLRIQNLLIETPGSRMALNGRASYNSYSELQSLDGTVRIDALIVDSHIAVSDVLIFQPLLPLNDSTNLSMNLSASLTGSISDLRIERITASIGDSTSIELSGTITGLPDVQNAYYILTLHHCTTGSADISAVLIDSLVPQTVSIPSSIHITGDFTGTMSQFTASTNIVTSLGDISAKAAFDSSITSNRAGSRWKSEVTTNAFDVGTFIKDPAMLGEVSLKGSASGTGFRPDNMKGIVNLVVDKATVNGYPYRGLRIRGSGGPTNFSASAEMRDSSIDFSLKGSYTRKKELSAGTLQLTINGSDLRRLNVTTDDIRVSGTLAANLSGTAVTNISGSIAAREIVIMKNGTQYRVDSVIVTSAVDSGKSIIIVDSPILEAGYEGTIAPADLPAALQRHLEYYFSPTERSVIAPSIPETFKFHIGVRNPSILTAVLFPDLHQLNIGLIEGSYNSAHHDLHISMSIPAISYDALSLDSLKVIVSSNEDQLQGAVTIRSIADSMFLLTNLLLSGTVRHDSMHVVVQSTADDGFMKMFLAGSVRCDPDGYAIHLDHNGVMFHNTAWSIPADHVLHIGTKGITAEKFRLNGGGQTLSINNSSDLQRMVTVEFHNFSLSTLSRIVARDSGLVGGIINGTVLFNGPQGTVASDLKIGNVSVMQRQLGDISFHLNSHPQGYYAVRMGVAGHGNIMAVKGSYGATHAGEGIDLECIFTSVNLATLEPFTFGAVRQLSGTVNGTVRISGTMAEPALAGHLTLMNVEFTPAILESHFRLHNAGITFTPSGIEFTEFIFKDIRGNSATLAGHLFTSHYQQFRYDLRMKTRKFLLMNSTFQRDALYYGTIVMNSNITVRGDGEKQRVTMQASVVKGTDFALVLPKSELDVEERKGIVQFAGLPAPLNSIMSGTERRVIPNRTRNRASTWDVTSNISVNQETKLRILIDPISGDSLVVQGNATFSVTMDPGGKLSVTGRYEIVNGKYQLSFGDFIHREFTIANGSSLTWLGSPVDADIDITAIYTVKASFLDLIQGQMSGMSNEEKTKYKQKLPIRVFMNMKGKLRSPNIHFSLDLPPAQRGALNGTVYAKLMDLNGQESELNKQVFALLVLGRFVQENPVSSSDGSGGISDLARSSVSQILSAQLNLLSERYIAGASLAVGLDSYKDYSSGTEAGRTQLQLALSKQLFNERVTVTVGGNVDLEGDRSQKNSLNSIASDLAVQYKLTEDGRWQLQVFRQNAYEGAIDGDITKTGAGVAFTIDFNKLFGITLKPETNDEE